MKNRKSKHAVIQGLLKDGICQLCGERSKRLEVDHNHETGMVRGVICSECNRYVVKAGEVRPRLVAVKVRLYLKYPPLASYNIAYSSGLRKIKLPRSLCVVPIWRGKDILREVKRAARDSARRNTA